MSNITDYFSNEMIVEICFHRSKSRYFNKALSIAKAFPYYESNDDFIVCALNSIYDFCRLQLYVYELVELVSNWKNSKILLYGKLYKRRVDYNIFIKQIKANAGYYSIVVHDNESELSGGEISIEELPYPIVYYPMLYGAFFAFSKDVGSQILFCECERDAIENYVKLRQKKPLTNYTGNTANPLGTDCFPKLVSLISKNAPNDPLSLFEFKKGICFRCNKKVPLYKYCSPMYGGSFKQHYGWYIKQEYYRLGIDKLQMFEMNVLEDKCEPEIYDSLKRFYMDRQNRKNDKLSTDNKRRYVLDIPLEQIIENSVRTQLGFKKIGDLWISETIMYEIVCQIFEGFEIKRHYRPSWLEGLELDVYVPEKKIAFEYQGIQHFKAVKHWGGESQLQKQKEHDARKKRICKEMGIKLFCINYDEPLSTEFIINRIKGDN